MRHFAELVAQPKWHRFAISFSAAQAIFELIYVAAMIAFIVFLAAGSIGLIAAVLLGWLLVCATAVIVLIRLAAHAKPDRK